MARCLESVRWSELAVLIAILTVALVLRTWQLNSVPPGLTHDEANNVYDAVSVLRGERAFYFPVAQGKEPLYLYSVALMMVLLGPTPLALRLTSVFWGVLLLVLTYAWTRRSFGRLVALWTVSGLAISFWGVSTSRLGLRAVALPVLLTAGVLAFPISDTRPPGLVRSVVAGLCLGLTFYTYLAARVMPALFLLFGAYLALKHPARLRECWPQWLIVLTVTAAVAAPLFLYLRAHPAASVRIAQLEGPLRAFFSGSPGPLLREALDALRVFSFEGDGFTPYNIPGRPLFSPLMSVLFYGGLIVALWRWREPACAFALLWLVVGFSPALATGADAANLRAIAAQPVSFLFPALAFEKVWDLSLPQPQGRRLAFVGIMGSVVLASAAFLTIRDYFLRWPVRRDVRVHYHTNLTTIANTIRGWGSEEPVGISAFYPGEYHDPRIVDAIVTKEGPCLRWFDGRQALILPSSSTARLIVPEAIPLDNALWSLVRPETSLSRRVLLRPGDFNASFSVYRWTVPETQRALRDMMIPPFRPSDVPVDVGGVLSFQGYQVLGWTGEPGGGFSLLTLWDIDAALPDHRDAVLFSQLLDSNHQVVAQQDQLGAPSWNWHPGDAFVQLHRLALPADTQPGVYTLITGVYTTPDRIDAVLAGQEPDPAMPRLPVRDGQPPASDAITLVTLEVP